MKLSITLAINNSGDENVIRQNIDELIEFLKEKNIEINLNISQHENEKKAPQKKELFTLLLQAQ